MTLDTSFRAMGLSLVGAHNPGTILYDRQSKIVKLTGDIGFGWKKHMYMYAAKLDGRDGGN